MNRIAALLIAMALFACKTTGGGPGKMPEGYVITPNGLVHASCIRVVPSGSRISEDGVITTPAGDHQTLAPCPYPRLDPRLFTRLEADGSGAPPSFLLAAHLDSSVPLGGLSATFVVPPPPPNPLVIIFLFPAMAPAAGHPLLQPVLGWHPEHHWTINPAYCCPQGGPVQLEHISVNPGDTITGSMTISCSSAGCDWTIVTTDVSTGQSTSLIVGVSTPITSASAGVLEAHYATECAQLPASDAITFMNITLQDQQLNPLAPSWEPHYWQQGYPGGLHCSYHISTTPRAVTLTWQTDPHFVPPAP